ncbi:MAG: flavodoxin family protein [Alphaproteobacteria bacterium]|nr:flavodoxin family protein [Alphaproteobacteria bacterium]
MKHALILGHPKARSFAGAVADAYRDAAQAAGAAVVLRDLYDIQFDPRLGAPEVPAPQGFTPAADVLREREIIGDADVFAFVYPLWFNAPPAIVSGYVQRVFGMGFGFGPIAGGANAPLLTGCRLATFTSSGAPTEWLVREGAWEALQQVFDRHFADACGMVVAEHVHCGGLSAATRADVIEAYLARTREAATRLAR